MATRETLRWSKEIAREYLRPPGDSARRQAELEQALARMRQSAVAGQVATSVTIIIDPAL